MEKINVSDSLLFMLSCREALAGIVETSSMASADKGRSRDFLFNEATDYQIMSLILKGDLPKEKYNKINEQILYMEFKNEIAASADLVSEAFGNEVLSSVLFEIQPLYPKYSSQVPVLEFLTSSKAKVVVEGPAEAIGGAAEKISAVWNAFKNQAVVKAVAADLKVDPNNMNRGSEVDRLILKQLEKAKGNVNAAVQGLKDRVDKGWLKSKLSRLNKGRTDASRTAADAGIWSKIQNQVKLKSMDAKAAVNNAVKQAQQYSAQNPEAKYIAGAVLAALAIFGAYKTYKRFFSKAAKACSGRKGAERKGCLKNYKVQAIKAQISDLQSASGKCSASKDPGKCKATIGNKIQKLQTKAQKAAA